MTSPFTSTTATASPSTVTNKKSNRCSFCKKKQLIIVNCKCGGNFCLTHKHPETHDCSYDYKADNENLCNIEAANFKKVEII